MPIDVARSFLIISSLIITGAILIFMISAPEIGYPLEWPQNLRILQIVLPVFLGYLGSAAYFIFKEKAEPVRVRTRFLGLLVIGPMIIYALAMLASLVVFGFSNRAAQTGAGMTVDELSDCLTASLSLLSVTTNFIITRLF